MLGVDLKSVFCVALGAGAAVAVLDHLSKKKKELEMPPHPRRSSDGGSARGLSLLASPTSPAPARDAESQEAVDAVVMAHYAEDKDILPYKNGPSEALQFPARCAALCSFYCKSTSHEKRAIDVGCGAGRASFELTRRFEEVVGVDVVGVLVVAAERMRDEGQLEYVAVDEADIFSPPRVAKMPKGCLPERAVFERGDACKLGAQMGQFDAVLASGLISGLADPMAFLGRLPSLVKPGGVVLLADPWAWDEERTDRRKWLGGYVKNGQPVHTAAIVKAVMEYAFELVDELDMPYLLRESCRKYEWGCAHATVWRRQVLKGGASGASPPVRSNSGNRKSPGSGRKAFR